MSTAPRSPAVLLRCPFCTASVTQRYRLQRSPRNPAPNSSSCCHTLPRRRAGPCRSHLPAMRPMTVPRTRRFVPQSCGGLAGAMQWESRGIMFTSLLNCTRHADPKRVALLSVWPSRQKATRTFLKLPPVIKLSAAAVTNGLQRVACRVQSRAWRNYPTTDFTASLIFCIFSGVST